MPEIPTTRSEMRPVELEDGTVEYQTFVVQLTDAERDALAAEWASEALRSKVDPLFVIREKYMALPDDLQEKYEDLIVVGAFHLERGNIGGVLRKFRAAAAILDQNNPTEVEFFTFVQQALGFPNE